MITSRFEQTRTPFPELLLTRVSSYPYQGDFMDHFSVAEQVVVRYGKHHGQKATIMKSQPGDAYKVKVEDGTVLFFSGKGLEKENGHKVVS